MEKRTRKAGRVPLGEHDFGHYYKKSTFDSPYMPIRQGERYKRHPHRQPWAGEAITYIRPENVKIYRAHKLPEPPARSTTQRNNNSTNNQSNRNRNTRRNTSRNSNSNTNRNSNNTSNSSPGMVSRLRSFFGF